MFNFGPLPPVNPAAAIQALGTPASPAMPPGIATSVQPLFSGLNPVTLEMPNQPLVAGPPSVPQAPAMTAAQGTQPQMQQQVTPAQAPQQSAPQTGGQMQAPAQQQAPAMPSQTPEPSVAATPNAMVGPQIPQGMVSPDPTNTWGGYRALLDPNASWMDKASNWIKQLGNTLGGQDPYGNMLTGPELNQYRNNMMLASLLSSAGQAIAGPNSPVGQFAGTVNKAAQGGIIQGNTQAMGQQGLKENKAVAGQMMQGKQPISGTYQPSSPAPAPQPQPTAVQPLAAPTTTSSIDPLTQRYLFGGYI